MLLIDNLMIAELKWLCAPKNGIDGKQRIEYFDLLQKMAYTQSKVSFFVIIRSRTWLCFIFCLTINDENVNT